MLDRTLNSTIMRLLCSRRVDDVQSRELLHERRERQDIASDSLVVSIADVRGANDQTKGGIRHTRATKSPILLHLEQFVVDCSAVDSDQGW